MLHEARDRQKFVSDVQYLRDMQHKVDSEYQACLRRQESRKDPNEKKRDQFWGPETSFERTRFSSGSSSKQSSSEEDPLTEPRSSTKVSPVKCDSRLPAIDQTSVKQKHKSTMTPRKTEKAGPSKPSPAAQAPKILSKKRRPKLGRLTVSPEMHNPRGSGDKSRQKLQLQLPAKALAPRGTDLVAQQEGPMWAGDTKLKRPPQDRRNLVPSSQLMTTENPPERAKKGDPSALSQSETHSALSQAFRRTNSPQVLSKSLGPPLTSTSMGGPRRAPFRFRDEDFYPILSLNTGRENADTEEETHGEEELLLVGMHPHHSPSNHIRRRFWGTSATQAKNKTVEENSEKNRRANSLRRSEPNRGSLRIGDTMEPVTKPPSVGQRLFQDPGLLHGESAEENDSGGGENTTFHSWDTKSEPRRDDGLNAENISSDCISMEDRPGAHDYERDWQDYLNSSRNSLDYYSSSSRAGTLTSFAGKCYVISELASRLLEEDSEEEGDLCRICQIARGSPSNPLLEPCGCVGSLQFVHQECLKKWLEVKITSGADLGAVKTCEMCKQGLLVDLDDFNVTEFYQKHQQSWAQNELMNSGLYLVLLLHLYEQGFAELMRVNYSRVVRERLSRNCPQPRPEENENSELGDGSERVSQSRVV
ncbi:PREDICTED: probable E3 ubiquitin-protein ligase MARCH10 [Propithecus coquereli]|uniref:probable E3 ubiquitin-protein ligase MARCH10 n=1 Tax=Propithecus coquereli TaxID=379532 RepID=UPI00063EFB9B|nr:PREDICTED: probable E3 ubiquitin-protein ligase MARCH10 [Propithecus coquereli]